MFSNPGEKIKALAVALFVLAIVVSIIVGIAIIINDSENASATLQGSLIMIIGSIMSWISSLLLYGFGQLIENSDKTIEFYETRLYDFSPVNSDSTQPPLKPKWKCQKCGAMVTEDYDYCPLCRENAELTRPKKFRSIVENIVFEPVDTEDK